MEEDKVVREGEVVGEKLVNLRLQNLANITLISQFRLCQCSRDLPFFSDSLLCPQGILLLS
jgi:hypothetical protein